MIDVGVVYLNVSMMTEEKANLLVDKQLDLMKGWLPNVRWFVIPVRDQNTKIEFHKLESWANY